MDEISKVLKAIDYRSFYQRHIPGLKLNGNENVSCLCPFHKEENPSFSINIEKGLYNCFRCGGGNAIQFVQKRYGLDFNEALKKVKDEEDIKSDSESGSGRKPKSETRNTERETASKSKHLTLDQIKLIHNQLLKNEAALKKFQDKYGLTRPSQFEG